MNIYLDFETFPIKPGVQAPTPVSLSVCESEKDEAYICTGSVAKQTGTRIVQQENAVLVASNIPFEFEVLSIHWGLRSWVRKLRAEGRARCTETQERLLRIHQGEPLFRVGLAPLVKRYFSVDISADKGVDSVRTRYNLVHNVPLTTRCPEGPCFAEDFEDAPPLSWYFDITAPYWAPRRPLASWPKEFALYALKDPEWTRAVHQAQEKLFAEITGFSPGTPITDIGPQVNAKASLNRMRSLGALSNQSRVQETIKEFIFHRELLWKLVVASGIGRPDGTKDMKVLRERVEAALGDEAKAYKTDKGQTRTDRSTVALAATYAKGKVGTGYVHIDGKTVDVVLEALSVLNTLDKFLAAYLAPLNVPEGEPIHWHYTELVNTGRTSASASWQANFVDGLDIQMRSGTNFQNFPTPRSLQNLAKRIARVESFL